MSYRILTDATADMSPEMFQGLPEVVVIPMEVTVGDDAYTYGPGGNLTVTDFYAAQRGGKFATTSQINPLVYTQYFEDCLSRGEDVVYLGFTSGMSGSFQNARLVTEELREKYPQRKLYCIDTLCASVGEGMLVREAARKQGEGLTVDELAQWAEAHKLNICHWFTVDTFEHLRHGGRVSAVSAALGTALQIKPMLHVAEDGTLEVKEKPRGSKRAMEAQISRMCKGWTPEEGAFVLVGHGDAPERAEELRQAVSREFPQAQVCTAPIGPIIGSHTGPGMLALIFWGTER